MIRRFITWLIRPSVERVIPRPPPQFPKRKPGSDAVIDASCACGPSVAPSGRPPHSTGIIFPLPWCARRAASPNPPAGRTHSNPSGGSARSVSVGKLGGASALPLFSSDEVTCSH